MKARRGYWRVAIILFVIGGASSSQNAQFPDHVELLHRATILRESQPVRRILRSQNDGPFEESRRSDPTNFSDAANWSAAPGRTVWRFYDARGTLLRIRLQEYEQDLVRAETVYSAAGSPAISRLYTARHAGESFRGWALWSGPHTIEFEIYSDVGADCAGNATPENPIGEDMQRCNRVPEGFLHYLERTLAGAALPTDAIDDEAAGPDPLQAVAPEAGDYTYLLRNRINLRAAPGASEPILRRLDILMSVQVLETAPRPTASTTQRSWQKVAASVLGPYPDATITGYVATEMLAPVYR